MSRPLHDRLRELRTEVEHLRVRPAAAVRARGGRRRRRQLAATAVGVAVLTTAAGFTATRAFHPHRTNPTVAGSPPDRPAVACNLALPDDPAQVRIRVVDGGASGTVAAAVAADLRERRFTVLESSATTGERVSGVAVLHYGPAAIGAAVVVRAEVHGDAGMWFDPARPDDTIELMVGPSFRGLATATETNQALAAAGEPTAPPQCSAVATPTRTP